MWFRKHTKLFHRLYLNSITCAAVARCDLINVSHDSNWTESCSCASVFTCCDWQRNIAKTYRFCWNLMMKTSHSTKLIRLCDLHLGWYYTSDDFHRWRMMEVTLSKMMLMRASLWGRWWACSSHSVGPSDCSKHTSCDGTKTTFNLCYPLATVWAIPTAQADSIHLPLSKINTTQCVCSAVCYQSWFEQLLQRRISAESGQTTHSATNNPHKDNTQTLPCVFVQPGHKLWFTHCGLRGLRIPQLLCQWLDQ